MAQIKLPVSLLALFFGLQSFAAAPLLVIRVELDRQGELEQSALIYEKGKLKISRNSNFLCEDQTPVELGVFEMTPTGAQKSILEMLAQSQERLKQRHLAKPEILNAQPSILHGQRIFLGTKEIEPGSKEIELIDHLSAQFCKVEPSWKRKRSVILSSIKRTGPLQTVQITRHENGRTFPSEFLSVTAPECSAQGRHHRCRIADFGYAWLVD